MCFLRMIPSLRRKLTLTQQTGVTGKREDSRKRKGRDSRTGGPPPVMGGVSVGVAGEIEDEEDKAEVETTAARGMRSTEMVMEEDVAAVGGERMERHMAVIMVGVAGGEVWVRRYMCWIVLICVPCL